ncbi:MAG: DNA polymerase/3'-5' exonuclease PolX [Calditrichaceae bacterium]|nr:DNA polymerase/3'-5' exonuclease PolX [Calditrichaceae bacterium]MBN2707997.1 DNA polymerase/3'-5' exonuclease PolX [Calditrichaceae bacterium]
MGAKKVKTVYEKLGVDSIGSLEYACKENRLRDLPGFGQKTQDNLLKSIQLKKKYDEQYHYPPAKRIAEQVLEYLHKAPGIIDLEIAGSLRRKKEIIHDIDIVGSAKKQDQQTIMDYFVNYPDNKQSLAHGKTKTTIVMKHGIHCDLRLVETDQFPFLLHHSTGSKEHNTAMRQLAKDKNCRMNEYGIFKGNNDKSEKCADEHEIYSFFSLQYIPPELRENMGEIEAAGRHELPNLVQENQIKGVFHAHSVWSDGSNSIRELAEKCRSLGFEYLGITDHSKSAFYANGLDEERIKKQHEEIEKLNEEFTDFTIFIGIESDILTSGKLDYDDDVLESFDFVIASVHSAFNLSQKEMTKRICSALKHPCTTMLGHPSGRLLLGREAYQVDMEAIIECAVQNNVIIEINANPHRLDMDWHWGRLAEKHQLITSINPDAHSIDGIEDFRYGVGIARKGWFTADRVLNTRSCDAVTSFFKLK